MAESPDELSTLPHRVYRHVQGGDPPSWEELLCVRGRAGLPSRCGSEADLYSTIPDVDHRLLKLMRNSSDTASVSSHPDLRSVERLPCSNPVHSVGPSASPSSTGSFADLISSRTKSPLAESGSADLLLLSDSDLPQAALAKAGASDDQDSHALGQGSVLPSSATDTKAALLDFFLKDATFHSNPMVTGNLAADGAWPCQPPTDTPPVAAVPQAVVTTSNPAAAAVGWTTSVPSPSQSFCHPADRSGWPGDAPTHCGVPLVTGLGPDTFPMSANTWALQQVGADAALGGWEKATEGVYIDMKTREDGTGYADCEYVGPQGVTKSRAALDSAVFQ